MWIKFPDYYFSIGWLLHFPICRKMHLSHWFELSPSLYFEHSFPFNTWSPALFAPDCLLFPWLFYIVFQNSIFKIKKRKEKNPTKTKTSGSLHINPCLSPLLWAKYLSFFSSLTWRKTDMINAASNSSATDGLDTAVNTSGIIELENTFSLKKCYLTNFWC